jgi:hypothetical protein
MDSPLVSIVGTVEHVGPVELGPDDDTTYEYIIIRPQGHDLRTFSMVHARDGVSQLVEPHTSGLFVLKHTREENRLWCIVCADGRQAMDFQALRAGTN